MTLSITHSRILTPWKLYSCSFLSCMQCTIALVPFTNIVSAAFSSVQLQALCSLHRGSKKRQIVLSFGPLFIMSTSHCIAPMADLTQSEVLCCHNQQVALKLLLDDSHRHVSHVICICLWFELVYDDLFWQLYCQAASVDCQLLDIVLALYAYFLLSGQVLHHHISHMLSAEYRQHWAYMSSQCQGEAHRTLTK